MSNEKRKTIGRQLNTQASIAEMTDTGRSQVFTLKTGRKVTFRFVRVPASEVESKTFVNQENNGRDQLALTRESLKSIIQTIKFQQFFPCIGIKGTVAKLAMRQPFVLFKGLTFQKLCLPGAF
ncbi:hypothetical protein M2T90_27325, partial [Klebsiella pneumoniae]|nr:hypothetical protein [Klebsiella pneumoniae]